MAHPSSIVPSHPLCAGADAPALALVLHRAVSRGHDGSGHNLLAVKFRAGCLMCYVGLPAERDTCVCAGRAASAVYGPVPCRIAAAPAVLSVPVLPTLQGLCAGAGLCRGHVAVPVARPRHGPCCGDSLGVTQAGRELVLQCEPKLNITPASGAGRLVRGGSLQGNGDRLDLRLCRGCLVMLAAGRARLVMEECGQSSLGVPVQMWP